MHWTYQDSIEGEETVERDLQQGDLLGVSENIRAHLKKYHPHYANHAENLYFMVLTQSCDLVRRGGKPKATYIALAPVRSVEYVIQCKLNELKDSKIDVGVPVCSKRAMNELRRFLDSLLNNNAHDYFYLHEDPSLGLPESCCALLRLGISFRATHYADFCAAYKLSLTDTFQAKLGWLVGQLFSRVGTQDWSMAEKKEQIDNYLNRSIIEVEDKDTHKFQRAVAQWRETHPNRDLEQSDVEKLLASLPQRKREIKDRLVKIVEDSRKIKDFIQQGQMTEQDVRELRRDLENDPKLAQLLK